MSQSESKKMFVFKSLQSLPQPNQTCEPKRVTQVRQKQNLKCYILLAQLEPKWVAQLRPFYLQCGVKYHLQHSIRELDKKREEQHSFSTVDGRKSFSIPVKDYTPEFAGFSMEDISLQL